MRHPLVLVAALLTLPSLGRTDEGTECVPASSDTERERLYGGARSRTAEWTAWLGLGGGVRDLGYASSRGVFAARLGAGVSLELARLWSPGYGGAYELRWGTWVNAETHLDGVLGEAGLELSLGQVVHARWGTYTLRVGGGYASDAGGGAPHVSVTLTGGVRSVPDRYAPHPRAHAWATGVRLFLTARVPAGAERGTSVVGGLEFEPSFFLPPYSVTKWIGARP